ncbi:hypothetical protein KEM52_000623 [Ascosphaera acerosa]|nr:hypothetical protein KEM52_000623 [Ascosphaera acerosa]
MEGDNITLSRQEFNEMRKQLEEMREMLQAQRAAQQTAPASTQPAPQLAQPVGHDATPAAAPDSTSAALDELLRRPRHSLPNVPLYDGRAYNFAQFITKLKAKLSADRHAIGSEHNCVLYGYNRQDLRPDALSKLQYMKQGKKTVGQSSIDEGAKIQWFKNELNKELWERMIGQQVFSLDEYCYRVSQIEFELNDERRRSGRRTNFAPYNTNGH